MPREQLTDTDMAEHRVTFRDGSRCAKKVTAAYIAAEERHPDMLVFKDSSHRTVYMVNRQETLEVERLDRTENTAGQAVTE